MRRRAGTVFACAAALAAVLAPSAIAAPASIEAGVAPGQNVFGAANHLHDAGTVAQLSHVAGGAHNATATAQGPDGKALFRSSTISLGSTPVDGTQYIGQGVYPFVCTIHPGMSSQLTVPGSGTPLPRPSVTAKITAGKLAKVLKKAKVPVKVNASGGTATVNVRLGKRTIGVARSVKGARKTVIPLTRKGHGKLEKRKKAKLTVVATIDFGSPAQASRKLK